MGIQINGNTDNISATDGGLTVSDLEINQSGISTFNNALNIGTGSSIFSPATNTFTLGTNSAERLRIQSNGDVIWNGIGTQLAGEGNNTVGMGFEPRNGTIFLSRADNALIVSNRNNDGRHIHFNQGGTGKFAIGLQNSGADLAFFSGAGNSPTERARITSGGRILIATTAEGHSNADDLTIATAAGSLGNTGITIRSSTTGDGNIFFSDATSGDGETKGVIKYAHNTDHMQFNTAGSTRLLIDSSGRLLVNTTTTYAGDNTMIIAGESPSGGTYDLYDGQLLITSTETSGAVNTGGVIQFYGHDGGSSRGFGSIRCLKENGTSGNHNAYMAFLLRVNGGTPTERLSISSGGHATISASSYSALTINTTNNGTNGPEVQLMHTSTSPAANDVIGQIRYSGKDSAGNTTLYSKIETKVDDPTNGQETGHIDFSTRGLAAYNSIFRLKARGTASAPSYTTDDMNGIILDTYNTGNPYPRYMNFIAKSAGNTASNIGFWTEAVGGSPIEKLRITSDGKIGVNATTTALIAPTYTLDLGGNDGALDTSEQNTLRIRCNNGGTAIRVGPGGGGSQVVLIRVDGNSNGNNCLGETDAANFGASITYRGDRSGNENSLGFYMDNTTNATQVEALNLRQNGDYIFGGSSYSDRDQKENITSLPGTALDKITQLSPRTWNWKPEYHDIPTDRIFGGFIAQEVLPHIPSIVRGTDGQGDMSLDYQGLLAWTIKALTELKSENDNLKARVNTLESS